MKVWLTVRQFTTLMTTTALLIASVSFSPTLVSSILVTPTLAADPFRSDSQARKIGEDTEDAFVAIFRQGNYTEGKESIARALKSDPQEPLVYTLAAGLAFLDQDWAGVNRYANQTIVVARQLVTSDPLRGNLYQAVGTFLLAAYDVSSPESGVLGTPQALLKVQRMFQYLDQAKAIAANDPELNLLQGYLEWGIASNLGLYSPDQAIQRLDDHAQPPYLSYRGIALVYRDLNRPQDALNAVNLALKAAPRNPELFILKAQIVKQQKNYSEALRLYNQALDKQSQLPTDVVQQITRERDQIKSLI